MKYYREILAIPCEQARKAGAKTMTFKYVDSAAAFFGVTRNDIYKKIRNPGKRNLSLKGFYIRFKENENDLL